MGGECFDPERVGAVGDQGHEVIDPPPDVSLPHPELHTAVEHLHHRHRVDLTAVDAADRHGAAAPDCLHSGV